VLLERAAVEIEVQPIADRTRSLVTLTCRDAPAQATRLLFGEAAARIAAQLLDSANILIASDAIGGAEAACAITMEYLKTRVQFGKPIGSFQALKHRSADHKVAIEAARRLVDRAQGAPPDAPRTSLWAALAKMAACDAFVAMAADMIQMHGGIGFTWEHDAHLYLKRAMLDQFLFGSTAVQLDRAAALMLARETA
jgi:alkylation response protein AidB-like acyl-CoA dehydrogenase